MSNQALFYSQSKKDLQKLLKYFNRTRTAASNLLLLSVVFAIILSNTQKAYLLLFCFYLSYY